MTVLFNGDKIKNEKYYYYNALVKFKNSTTVLSFSTSISFTLNSADFNMRFYKIKSFHNDIQLQYIIKLITKKFTTDIADNIIKHYVKDNVSFFSMKKDNTYNTIQYYRKINYNNNLNKYKLDTNYPKCNSKNNDIIKSYLITKKISEHFEYILNSNISFDLNSIFFIKDKDVDFCFPHKIYSTKNGWGITWNNL